LIDANRDMEMNCNYMSVCKITDTNHVTWSSDCGCIRRDFLAWRI